MEKREKIIRELEIVKRRVARLDHFEEEAETIEDAIALLKEQQETIWALEIDLDDTLDVMCEYAEKVKAQEPIRPRIGIIHNKDGSTSYFLHCPFDGTVIDVGDRFCRKCGRSVKWDAPEADERSGDE